MCEKKKSESVKDAINKPVSNRATGAAFLFLAILIIVVGAIAHYAQTTVFDISSNEVIFQQLDVFFIEYVFVGFFTGIFFILGIYYLRLKNNEVAPIK